MGPQRSTPPGANELVERLHGGVVNALATLLQQGGRSIQYGPPEKSRTPRSAVFVGLS